MVGFAISLTACQKNEGLVSDAITTSSFTITIPQSGISTRAVTDAFGTGTSVNRCILEIYHSDQLYSRIVKPISNKQVTFDNLRLVSSQEYDFVFWADCATANSGSDEGFDDKVYITTATGGLKAITEKGEFVGNSDERDAFFAKESFEVTGSFTESVTLKRPFGLLVVKTNDLNEIKDEALKPTGYKVAFKGLATTFNALTGEVSGSADVTYTAEELAKADGTISMDFLWATDTEAALSDFSMTFLNNSTEICTNDAFTNIPIRRNYRTNVSGNLLTKQGAIDVTIDPEFYTPDYNVDGDAVAIELTAAGTLNEHLDELAEATGIRIAGPMNTSDLDAIQKLLKTTDGKDAPLKTLDLSQATGLTGNIAVSPDGSSSTYKNNTLKTIVLPEGVTSIKTWAFAGFYALTEINIPSTVTTIGMSAFRNCRSLESITLPEGITEIPTNCFWYATQLKTVNIPSTVREIADGAFSFTALEGDLVFGENLEVIGGSAFYRCKLTSVDLSKTKITKLNGMMNTFADCSELTRLVLPPAITEIGTTAFSGCPVETIDLPATVTKIANNSFYWGAAKTVICRATVPPTLSAKIYPSQTETVLKVPAEAIGDYKTATNWNTGRFKAIEAIE